LFVWPSKALGHSTDTILIFLESFILNLFFIFERFKDDFLPSSLADRQGEYRDVLSPAGFNLQPYQRIEYTHRSF